MNELEKVKSTRGGRKIHEKYTEPNLYKDADSILENAQKKGLFTKNALDIESLIKSMEGIDLVYTEMTGGLSGSLQNVDGTWIMKINSKHHKNRQRFTIAHELGHYLMHKDKNSLFEDTTFFRGAQNNAMEFAANEFASSILMPQNSIKKLLDSNIRELADLADEFNVSPSAMKYRLEKLGYNLN